MYDMHYDLLTAIYMAYKNNDYNFIENWCRYYNKNNVIGLIANMCFESKEEMKEEYHPDYLEKDIISMFETSVNISKKLLTDNIDVLYAIEGLDYVEISDLDELYKLGLRSVTITWNEKNKYAFGVRYDGGLTSLGVELIDKLISLGIAIDLSHANDQTFFDIINIIKQYRLNGIEPVVFASHSNSRTLNNRKRNLSDEQLIALKEVDGYVGVMSNKNFVSFDSEALVEDYIKHIKHICSIIGFDHVCVSTDDMKFSNGDPIYKELSIYDYSNIGNSLRFDLNKYFESDVVQNILINNAKNIFDKLKKHNKTFTK